MDTYQTQEGTNRTQLNLLMRKSIATSKTRTTQEYKQTANISIEGNFEALARPQNRDDSTTGAESDTDPAHEPLSGVGQS